MHHALRAARIAAVTAAGSLRQNQRIILWRSMPQSRNHSASSARQAYKEEMPSDHQMI
jgi:hypothetical protein